MKIVFFGTPEYAAIILEHLIKFGGHSATSKLGPTGIEAVVTQPDKPVGRGLKKKASPVKILAKEHHLTTIDALAMAEISRQVREINPDLIILAAYMHLLPAELLNIPRYGGLNIHPSLLPKYAGVTPIQQAILNGDKETGVTIIKMNERYDEGEIVAQEKLSIKPDDTKQGLEIRLAELGGQLITKVIPLWVKGKITPLPQDPKLVRQGYTRKLTRADGYVSFDDLIASIKGEDLKLATIIERKLRAFMPWPGVWTTVPTKPKQKTGQGKGEKRLKILKGKPVRDRLVIDQVQLEGKKPITWAEFSAGYHAT